MTQLPRLPLPDEEVLWLLTESREVRILSELLIGVVSMVAGYAMVVVLWGPSGTDISLSFLSTALTLGPLILFLAMRPLAVFVVTSKRVGEVKNGRLLWSLRFDQISRIRCFGATLHLRGAGGRPYAMRNLRHIYWLEDHLWERASR